MDEMGQWLGRIGLGPYTSLFQPSSFACASAMKAMSGSATSAPLFIWTAHCNRRSPSSNMRRRSAPCRYRSPTREACDKTTGQRARMSRCDDGSGRCSGSGQRDRLSGSSHHMLGLQHFQHLSPSHHVCSEASVPDRGFRGMACRCGHCCLKRRSTTISSTEPNNVTNPFKRQKERNPALCQ